MMVSYSPEELSLYIADVITALNRMDANGSPESDNDFVFTIRQHIASLERLRAHLPVLYIDAPSSYEREQIARLLTDSLILSQSEHAVYLSENPPEAVVFHGNIVIVERLLVEHVDDPTYDYHSYALSR